MAAALAAAAGAKAVTPASGASAIFESVAGVNSPSALAAAIAGGAEIQATGLNVGVQERRIRGWSDRLRELFSPVPSALAAVACGIYGASSSTCGGSGDQVVEIIYSDCSFGGSAATWSGGEIFTFGGSASCGRTTLPIASVGDQLTRTFTGEIGANPTTRTSASGLVVSLDTSKVSGYSESVSGGEVITGVAGASGGAAHSIEVQGVHALSALWDYSISNSVVLTVQNSGASAVIESGTLTVQHNTAEFTAEAVFTNVAFDGSSCIPVSGSITSTYSGSVSGRETLTFTGGGNAVYTGPSGSSQSVALNQCF